MAAPSPAITIPRGLQHSSVALATKPSAKIHYSFVPGTRSSASTCLVIFLNGLVAPKALWIPVMSSVIQQRFNTGYPAMLTYDRYGQGLTTDTDPTDEGKEEGHGHDVADVVADLRQLITQIAEDILGVVPERLDEMELIFVANSLGCATARLYAQAYPGTVSGLLLLDSVMANSDYISIWPDSKAAGFAPQDLPDGVSVEGLEIARDTHGKLFHPSVPNKEGLSRRNLAELLPHSDTPKLQGPRDGTPLVTVVGHDPESFAAESFKSLSTPIPVTMNYTNPYWAQYNEGLAKITEPRLSKGPVIAKGCGHFIQRDDPTFVAEELCKLLDRL
ncbi:MAG: hypothetical protein M1827_004495 [Pycnora praestabilis]|nr:MAG: hypothetical protein M1827_004495 [Pycnora praestabilis]